MIETLRLKMTVDHRSSPIRSVFVQSLSNVKESDVTDRVLAFRDEAMKAIDSLDWECVRITTSFEPEVIEICSTS